MILVYVFNYISLNPAEQRKAMLTKYSYIEDTVEDGDESLKPEGHVFLTRYKRLFLVLGIRVDVQAQSLRI